MSTQDQQDKVEDVKDPQDNVEGVEDEDTSCRPKRTIKLTEKGQSYMKQLIQDQTLKFDQAYSKWKKEAKSARNKLKSFTDSDEIDSITRILEQSRERLLSNYEDLRRLRAPDQQEVRKVDCVVQVSSDIQELLNQQKGLCEMNFNPEYEKFKVRTMLNKRDYPSVFGKTDTEVSGEASMTSVDPKLKKREAEAELEVKKSQLKLLEEIQIQRKRVREETDKLEMLKAKSDVEVASVKLKSAVEEVSSSKSSLQGSQCCDTSHIDDMKQILQAFRDSLVLDRLPTPEPPIFTGDSLEFIEWRHAFNTLIETKCKSDVEKLFYLKRYTGGSAAKMIEGSFLRTDSRAYEDAWSKLNSRYGDQFIIQRAFRSKIHQWSKINDKDYKGLREFSDFLNTCADAQCHVKGLSILNDYEENAKIVSKLPNWLTRRWHRHVAEKMKENHEFPEFRKFCKFLKNEADVVCNPMTLSPLIDMNDGSKKQDRKGKSRVLTTQSDSASTKTKSTDATPSTIVCVYCSDVHSIHRCQKFSDLSQEEKKKFIQDNNLCFGCLRHGHRSKDCKKRSTCGKCKRAHPTPLHFEKPTTQKTEAESKFDVDEKGKVERKAVSCYTSQEEQRSSAMIVPVWVENVATKKLVLTYALLDTQSDCSYLLNSTAEVLELQGQSVRLKITTMTDSTLTDCTVLQGLRIHDFEKKNVVVIPKAYTTHNIPADRSAIPTSSTAKGLPHLKMIENEIPAMQDCDIGLLIGYDCPDALMPKEVISGKQGEPFAVKTKLGWSIIGGESRKSSICCRTKSKEIQIFPRDVLSVLEKDFHETTEEKSVSQEDLKFMKIMEETTKIDENGHLEMALPFKERPSLPINKVQAESRLNQLKGRFARNKKFRQDYVKFVEDIIQQGHAEEASGDTKSGEEWYIPHHGVYHPKKPQKIRVVFDCSSRFHDVSLNDCLLSGPEMTNSLVGVLIRFRKGPIAVACDVEKMFHQFMVRREDRNYLRFLWWPEGDIRKEPKIYHMNVHLFGATSSPACASYGLRRLAQEHKEQFPLAASFIQNNFYVDDGLISVNSVEEAVTLVQQSQELCNKGNIHLCKFISNARDVMKSIKETELDQAAQSIDLNHDKLPLHPTLGVRWNIERDTFFFKSERKDIPSTRRGVLSTVASVFDPLGFLAPFVLRGKMILQKMCKNGLSWDEVLPEELRLQWENWTSELSQIQLIEVPRYIYLGNSEGLKVVELHHFSDASLVGYGTCSYLRVITETNEVLCTLLMAKSRVAPLKPMTVPRLELTAAVVAVKMSILLKRELQVSITREVFWTDSQVVLGYIRNESKKFHMFVANRVQFIRTNSKPDNWHYISTKSNPADHASRGLPLKELNSTNWFHGSNLLFKSVIISEAVQLPEVSTSDPEVKKTSVFSVTSKAQQGILKNLNRFSKWNDVVRAIARLKRRAKGIKDSTLSTVQERQEAMNFLFKLVQDIEMPDTSKLEQFSPFKDDKGVMRIGGRLSKSSMSYEEKHPVILPKNSHVTTLIVKHYHEKVFHQGRGITLNEIRANGFWIINGSKLVANHLHLCVTCRKLRRHTEDQKMSDLPEDRVETSAPFTYCGMDCFGPFVVKNGRKEIKRYGLLVTCLCSRAIHIELLDDLTTDSFINGLRCVIAIRGNIRQLRSDQGTNFMGAASEFANSNKKIDITCISNYLDHQNCEFIVNPPSSSHRGGVWERQIRTVRDVLNGIAPLSYGRLDDSSLRTIFYEVMAIVNARPLTVTHLNDPSLNPLSPNHILTMKSSIPAPPPGTFTREDLYLRKRWRRVQYLVEQFWSRWKKEYLQTLTQRQRWLKEKRNVMVGDVVILMESESPRNNWPLGIVTETYPSEDALVRKVKIRIVRDGKISVLERPIQKIVVIKESESDG